MSAAHLLQIGIQSACWAGVQADTAGNAGLQVEEWFFPVSFLCQLGQDTKIIFNRLCRADSSAGTAFNADGRVYFVNYFFLAHNRMGRADGQAICASDT